MSKCVNIAPTKVCFFPTDGSPSVEILHHTIYENGASIGQAYTTLEDTETVLDLSTYLGGGVIGSCNPLKLYEGVCGVDIPAGYIAYANDCAVSTFSLATSVNDLYVHAIFETQTGQAFDVFTGAVFTAATGGVLATDISSIQIAVDAAMISQGFSAGDAIYGYNSTTNEVIIFFSPAADPALTGWTLEFWAGGDTTPGTYTNKCKFFTATKTESEGEKYIKVKTICLDKQIAQVPNCSGTLDNKLVDSITATYLLNQENKHTETVSDVITAVFGGTVAFTYTAPTNVAVSYTSVILANDTIISYRTDFGDGYNDVGPSPSHSYNSDGSYEIKGYGVTASGNKLLLYAKEVTIVGGVITYSGANPHTVARTYKVLVAKAFQDFCGALPVGAPYSADGSAYTLVGDFEVATPIIIDELEDNADYQASVATPVLDIQSGGVSIANGTFAASLGPDGTSRSNPGGLRSVTIRARRSNTTNALPGVGNQVLIGTTYNKVVLLTNEAVTYSVEDGNIQKFDFVETIGNAAALVTYNRL